MDLGEDEPGHQVDEQIKGHQFKGNGPQTGLNPTRRNPGQGEGISQEILSWKGPTRTPWHRQTPRISPLDEEAVPWEEQEQRMKCMEMPLGEMGVLEKRV